MLAKISQLIFANTGFHFVPIGSYRDARQVAGCLSDLYLRALRVLRGSNLAFLCALRVSVVSSKSIYRTLVPAVLKLEVYALGSSIINPDCQFLQILMNHTLNLMSDRSPLPASSQARFKEILDPCSLLC